MRNKINQEKVLQAIIEMSDKKIKLSTRRISRYLGFDNAHKSVGRDLKLLQDRGIIGKVGKVFQVIDFNKIKESKVSIESMIYNTPCNFVYNGFLCFWRLEKIDTDMFCIFILKSNNGERVSVVSGKNLQDIFIEFKAKYTAENIV